MHHIIVQLAQASLYVWNNQYTSEMFSIATDHADALSALYYVCAF